jgi:hypothetical protein
MRRAHSLTRALPEATESRPWIVEGGYIAGRAYDWCFFILSPLLAALLGWLVSVFGLDRYRLSSADGQGAVREIAVVALASAAFTHAHLVIVVFRTHLNREVFRRHPHRFTTVPIALFLACVASRWVFVCASVLTVWWDVYHSSLQTFGLGRIYDRRAGNDPKAGRRLDYWFNLALYAGPVLAGVNLSAHLVSFKKFDLLDAPSLSQIADAVLAQSDELRALVLAVGLVLLGLFLASYAVLTRNGYVIPLQKLALYLTTGTVSIACWGFGSFGQAFLIMNFFHALQYFAIVWWSERGTITRTFRWAPLGLGVLLSFGLGYGVWLAHRPADLIPVIALSNVVSLMHFWYDGFVWSVRKGHV